MSIYVATMSRPRLCIVRPSRKELLFAYIGMGSSRSQQQPRIQHEKERLQGKAFLMNREDALRKLEKLMTGDYDWGVVNVLEEDGAILLIRS